MKKLHDTQAASKLKLSRFSFVKVFSLATAAIFLSNVFPVFSANPYFRNAFLEGVKSSGVSYPQSIISVAGLNTSRISKDNYLTVFNKAGVEKANASDYGNKLSKNTLNTEDRYKQLIVDQNLLADGGLSPQPFPQTSQDTKMINVSNFSKNNLISNMMRSEDSQEKNGKHVVMIGEDITANVGESVLIGDNLTVRFISDKETRPLGWSTVVGYNAQVRRGFSVAIGNDTMVTESGVGGIAVGPYARVEQPGALGLGFGASGTGTASIAIGYASQAMMNGSIAIGSPQHFKQMSNKNPNHATNKNIDRTKALSEHAIAIGTEASALAKMSMALGRNSQAGAESGVALGAHSLASVKSGISGYVPVKKDIKGDKEYVWKSTAGAVSVGNVSKGKTRQIVAVAAGTEDTDAVNVAQLKAVQAAAITNGLKINTTGKDFADAIADAESSIALGNGANIGEHSIHAVAIGYNAKIGNYQADAIAIGANTLADKGGLAFGSDAKASGMGTIAIGHAAKADSISAIGMVAIGDQAGIADTDKDTSYAVTVGFRTRASVRDSIALGVFSVVDVAAGVGGYDPSIRKNVDEQRDNTWVSTLGALSIGNVEYGITRQIVGVAAGTSDTDAVNVAQLKALQNSINLNWELSVDDEDKTNVNSTNPVDLAAASSNLSITKGKEDNKIKFDLARSVILDNITSAALTILDGPKLTVDGIDANSTKITNVAAGTNSTDAVNFAQLEEIKEQVTAGSFVKQDTATRQITIGKDTDGDKINIANKDSGNRILSGVADGSADTDAVNVAQLKAVETLSKTGWNLAVNNGDVRQIGPNSTINFVAVSHQDKQNIKLTQENDSVSFDLSDDITVKNIEAHQLTFQADNKSSLTLTADGLRLSNGPQITTGGIDASGKKLTGLAKGTEDTDAVNKAQLDASLKDLSNNLQSENSSVVLYDKTEGENSTTDYTSVTFGKGKDRAPVGLHNVGNGQINESSHDAINGSQLYLLGNGLAQSLGGDAQYENGQWKAPKFKVKTVNGDGNSEEKEYDTVAKAFDGVGAAITNVKNEITKEITNVRDDSLVKKDPTTNRIDIGKEIEGSKISIANKIGVHRVISGVGEGKNNDDAVNKGQLD
ncbi:hypothetical protein, partial [Bartonella phoceensis]|uniref:hypothetical protein n=2 Tax=Bartonella phoceensis TaxID=270249 RepID=UPI001ABB3A7C